MTATLAQALEEGLVDAAAFFAGAWIGWQLGRWLGLDVLAPGLRWRAWRRTGAARKT